MENQVVIFELGSEYFGADIAKVESIIKMQAITKLPHTPEFVEGVTNLRGKILPVMDLRKRFDMPAQEVNKNNRIIVVNLNQTNVGMIVDEVSEVLTIPAGAVEAAPAISSNADSACITGIAKIDERLVILLDLQKVLSGDEQLVDEIEK